MPSKAFERVGQRAVASDRALSAAGAGLDVVVGGGGRSGAGTLGLGGADGAGGRATESAGAERLVIQ
jgi:hypothetical protein